MLIRGRDIAEKIYQNLESRVGELQKKSVTPQLAVILVGNDPRSEAYVLQKQNRGNKINAQINVYRYETDVTMQTLVEKIHVLNSDPTVHGILIQRPLPKHIDEKKLELIVDPQKDIDGFHPDSPYTLPLPLAVIKILEEIHCSINTVQFDSGVVVLTPPQKLKYVSGKRQSARPESTVIFLDWLKSQNIVILGKGIVGGKPIIDYLKKLGLDPIIIDSKTPHPQHLAQQADIIISAVGRENVIKPEMLKKGAILIGVGLFQGEDGKLHGDYSEEAIRDIAGFYTPTPGGVGPVNIAMLMDNLVKAAEKQTNS